jgi:ubiquinone/menaquinone biosynthesis C-methylase UbiE
MDYKPQYKYVPPFEFHLLTRVYDFALILVGFGRKFREKIVNAVEIKDDYKVLDIGCGTGVFLELLKEKYPKTSVVGIDPDKQALSIATKRLSKYQDVRLVNGFAEALPLDNQSADVVFSTLAFHHMPTDIKQKSINEIYRVLKPSGKLVIVDFGSTKHPNLYRFITFWEPVEYMKGNLDGLIPKFMQQTGFKNIKEDAVRFPVIHLVVGEK